MRLADAFILVTFITFNEIFKQIWQMRIKMPKTYIDKS